MSADVCSEVASHTIDGAAECFCFDLSAEGTPLAGAKLEIVETAGRARCFDCGAEVDLDGPIALGECGSANPEFLSGRELKIKEVEMG